MTGGPDDELTLDQVGLAGAALESEPVRQAPISTRRMAWAWVLRAGGAGSLLAAVVLGGVSLGLPGSWSGHPPLTVIVGDWFPTLLDLAIMTIGLGVIALVLAAMLAPARPDAPRRRMSIVIAGTLIIMVAISLPATVIYSGMQLLNRPSYVVLTGQSEEGCRIVVSEHSTLLDGSGRAGILQPDAVIVEWVREYRATDPWRRFARGAYTLTWDDETANVILLGGSSTRFVWTSNAPFTCRS